MTAAGKFGEQRDALAQGRFEGDFAAHRALGDFGDFRADARRVREFVDAFLPDQRRIHVGDQQALGAPGGGLDDKVGAMLLCERRQRLARGGIAVEKEVQGDAGIEPPAPREARQGLRGAREKGIAELRLRGIDDERGDEGGRGHELSVAIENSRAPHCRPDRERQVRRRARACAEVRRHDRQRRFDAGLSRLASPDRAPERGRGSSGAA